MTYETLSPELIAFKNTLLCEIEQMIKAEVDDAVNSLVFQLERRLDDRILQIVGSFDQTGEFEIVDEAVILSTSVLTFNEKTLQDFVFKVYLSSSFLRYLRLFSP